MTSNELYHYSMDSSELEVWQSFSDTIRVKCKEMELPEMGDEIVNNRLMLREPFCAKRGYSKQMGYYEVCEGDRGELNITIQTHSREEAVAIILSNIADAVSYKYAFDNKDELEKAHRPEWRFYSVMDGKEGNRCLYHQVENLTWKYDTEYDYRKYWFEMTISFLAKVMSEEEIQNEIEKYESYLNHHFENKFWIFDRKEMEFKTVGMGEVAND